MLQFVCDTCGNIQQPGETWINGLAVENVGTRAARREIVVDPAWRYERAVLPFAVHFCCVECKDNYVVGLFNKPLTILEIQRVRAKPGTGARPSPPKQAPRRSVNRKQVRAVRRRSR